MMPPRGMMPPPNGAFDDDMPPRGFRR
jgi:hypothetical protein